MSTLLYLHGVGDDGTRRDWWAVLRSVAADALDDVTVIAPDYSDLLSGQTTPHPVGRPARTIELPPVLSRRQYRARQTRLHSDLMAAGATSAWPHRRRGVARIPRMIDAVAEKFVMDVIYDEVNRYGRDEALRRAIRERVIEALPPSGDIVVLAHSLGALVGIDLVRHLPEGINVTLLITAASALARRRLPGIVTDLPHMFPYDRVGGWVNVFNQGDAVTRGTPIGMQFPQTIDVVAAGTLGDHSLATCVTEPGLATVLVDHLLDPSRAHHAVAWHGNGEPLPLPEAMELLSLVLLQHVGQLTALHPRATGDTMSRFAAAEQLVVLRGSHRIGATRLSDHERAASVLHDRLPESALPAVLVRLAVADPLAGLNLTAPKPVLAEARRRVAAEVGIPPDWIEMGRRAWNDTEGMRSPRERRRRAPDAAAVGAAAVAASIRTGMAPMGLMRVLDAATEDNVGDVGSACAELVARAEVAGSLGHPDPGTEERAALNRLQLLLGDARANAVSEGNTALADQVRRSTEVVGESLSLLARRGLGLGTLR